MNDARVDPETKPQMLRVLKSIRAERERQHKRWGQQSLPDGTGPASWPVPVSARGSRGQREIAQAQCERAAKRGDVTWRQVLLEEVAEAFAESDRHKLRSELVQVAAVAAAWIEHIDRRPTPMQALVQTLQSVGDAFMSVLGPSKPRKSDYGFTR